MNNKEYDEYSNLKLFCDAPSMKKEDLPSDFTDNAVKTVNEFIKKTYLLNYECLIYFDYITGEILRYSIGGSDEVKLTFEDGEFGGHCVASLHNHPLNVFSPPSGKNFGILTRDFEDYELIVAREELWILEAKGTYLDLIPEFNFISDLFFSSSFEKASIRYDDEKIIDKIANLMYGNQLSRYINDKNISNIQLTKKEYVKYET